MAVERAEWELILYPARLSRLRKRTSVWLRCVLGEIVKLSFVEKMEEMKEALAALLIGFD